MDVWRYFDVTHSWHGLMNPLAPERVLELGEVLRLNRSTRVLDIGCGHAELLLLWHERFGATGVGVDASPHHFARARERVGERAPGADLALVHGKGEEYRSDERFDVACCLGASWIWSGFDGTLRALAGCAKPGGVVVSGEPYWRDEPPPEYLAAEELERDQFRDLDGCRRAALDQGLELIWMAGSTGAEWDRYELLQSAALDEFSRANPNDPDLPEIRARRRAYDESYFRWGRRCLGFALWAFRAPS